MSLFTPGLFTTVAILVLVIFFLSAALRILKEYERGVIFRLGRIINAKGPGLIILIPIIDKMLKVSLRLVAMDVDPQDVITRDNVSVKVNAVIYFRVIDPVKAIVELKHIDLPTDMQRAMARQAEAERERRAKVINAEGEFQAATKLAEASVIIEKNPIALQLRYLQTMSEISTESNSTVIFPLPIELFRPFLSLLEKEVTDKP